MKQLILVAPLVLFACASTEDSTNFESMLATPSEEFDTATRERLIATVAKLEGRWQMDGPDGHQYIEFAKTSGGSVVRETMFPGEPHEMVNMYSLNGNTLMMTHYCGAGNQPRMHASELADGNLAFTSFAVSDLQSPDDHFMDSLTLAFIDENTIEERWTSTKDGVPDEMPVFRLTRVQ